MEQSIWTEVDEYLTSSLIGEDNVVRDGSVVDARVANVTRQTKLQVMASKQTGRGEDQFAGKRPASPSLAEHRLVRTVQKGLDPRFLRDFFHRRVVGPTRCLRPSFAAGTE